MSFPHLSLPYPASALLSSMVNQLETLSPSVPSPKPTKNIFPFFMPCFQENDQILKELYQAKICDIEGNVYPQFNFDEFPILTIHCQQVQASLQALSDFLNKQRQLDTKTVGEKETKQLVIPIQFVSFLLYLIQLSSTPRSYCQENGQVLLLPPIPIQDIQLIGSDVLGKLQDEPFRYLFKLFFGSKISSERIEQWFQMDHITRLFKKETHDHDVRILSFGNLSYQSYLSEMSLHYLSASIQNFDPSFYAEQLKSQHKKYQNIDTQKSNELLIKEFSLTEFGIRKRKLVDNENQYAILGFKTLKDKPTDLLYVGLNHQGKPTLKNSNLSSTNCWTVSLYSLLVPNQEQWVLKIGSYPFSAAKALVDLVCGISTIPDPNVDAWLRFLRDCERSMQSNREHKMAKNALAQKQNLSALLLDEILKNQEDKQVNPYQAISIFFRACLSLQTCSLFLDEECATLWQSAAEKGLFQLEKNSTNLKKQACNAIKQALIDERVPFSVLSAWIGLLAWIQAPLSATSHCGRPVFHLKAPLPCLLPIQPVENGKVLHNYLLQHSFPVSFHTLYQTMTSSHPSSFLSSPLLPYLSELQINPSDLKDLSAQALLHSSPVFNVFGLQLYLQISSILPDKFNLALIFQRLPAFLQQMTSPKQSQELVDALSNLTSKASPGYQEALKQIKQKEKGVLKNTQWISLLIQTGDRELILLAYSLWKELDSPRFARQHAQIGWSLYKALLAFQPRLALSLLQNLNRALPQKFELAPDESTIFSQLIEAYQSHAVQRFSCDLDLLLPFAYSLFEREEILQFENEKQRNQFANALIIFIEALHQQPSKQSIGDYFLIEASRKSYLDFNWQTKKWIRYIQKTCQQPQRAFFTFSLYQIVYQEKLLDFSVATQSHLQQLQIELGEALLKDNQEPLSLALLEKFSKEEIENSASPSFYSWVLHAFQAQARHPIRQFHWPLLEIFLIATLPHKRFETQAELHLFFQAAIKAFQTSLSTESTLKTFPFDDIDQLLGNQRLRPLMYQADEEWQELLLDYLEQTYSFYSLKRMKALWSIYEEILHLFNKAKTKKLVQLVRLFKLLSVFLEQSSANSFIPNKKILEWIKSQHPLMLEKLYQQKCVREVKNLLLGLDHYTISHDSLARYVWWVCKQEIATIDQSSFFKLLDSDTFENLSAQISPSDYSCLPQILSMQLSFSPATPARAWQWISWCLKISKEKTEIFKQADMMDNCLSCSEQFITLKEYAKSFEIFFHLSNLSDKQHQRATDQWLQITSALYPSCSLEMIRQLFLSQAFSDIRQPIEKNLSSFIPRVIERILSTPQTSEKQLAWELIQSYHIKDSVAWCALWTALDTQQDSELILKAWEAFKVQSDSSESPESWTLALVHLQKLNHVDLLNYFYQQEWLGLFSDPSKSQLKWQALEAVFLGAVNTLDPNSFNREFYNSILSKKIELIAFCQETKQKQEDVLEAQLLAQWNRKIELALIERLKSSTQPHCLTAACRLLYPPLKVYFEDTASSKESCKPYLHHFEKVISSYLALSTLPENEKEHQDLGSMITDILNLICQSSNQHQVYCLSLIPLFLKKPTLDHLQILIKLVLKILNEGSVEEIEALKPSFMTFVPLVLQIDHSEYRSLIENYLIQAFKLMRLSLEEKGTLTYHFLKTFFDNQTAKDGATDPLILDMMNLYGKWSPYLFAHPTLLKEIVDKVVIFTIPYASTKLTDMQDENKFSACLAQILNAKYQIKLTSAPAYQEALKSYFSWVIEATRKINPKTSFLIAALYRYIDKMIDQSASQPATIGDILKLIEEFCYLYPPQPLVETEEKTPQGTRKSFYPSLFELTAKSLLKKAYTKGVFEEHPKVLLALEIGISYRFSHIQIKKEHRPLFEKALQRSLECAHTPHSVTRAIQICSLMQPLFLPSESKHLFSYYEKIFKALQPFSLSIIQHDECARESLFDYLDRYTLSVLLPTTLHHRQLIGEVAQLYFKFGLTLVKNLSNVSNASSIAISFQAYYLVKCFELLRKQAHYAVFDQSYSSYLSTLKELLPLVKTIEMRPYNETNANLTLDIPPSTSLILEWLKCLFQSHLTKNQSLFILKASDKKRQRELLFQALNDWLTPDKNDHLDRLQTGLLAALNYLFVYQESQSDPFWMNAQQPDAVKLFEAIKKVLQPSSLSGKQQLNFQLMEFQFYFDTLRKDDVAYLKQVSSLVELIPAAASPPNKFPLMKFSRKLVEAVLQPSLKEDVFIKRQEIFLLFLRHMQPVFQNVNQTNLLKAQDLLIEILERGVDQGLLHETHSTAVELFQWSVSWIGFSSLQAPALRLLDLIFYKTSINEKNFKEVMASLIPSLCEHVIKLEDFTLSKRLVRFISILPISVDQQFNLFVYWLMTFPEFTTPDKEQKIAMHIQLLIQEVKEQHIFDNVQLTFEDTSTSSKTLRKLNFDWIKGLIRQAFEIKK